MSAATLAASNDATTWVRELADLLGALRESGWFRDLRGEDGGRDGDGAPYYDGDVMLHRWRRGASVIEVPVAAALWPWSMRAIDYNTGEGYEFSNIIIGVEWVAERGIAALRAVAEAAGVVGPNLYPPNCKECDGGGSGRCVDSYEPCPRCDGHRVEHTEAFSNPLGVAA